jgi:hypothetical protein
LMSANTAIVSVGGFLISANATIVSVGGCLISANATIVSVGGCLISANATIVWVGALGHVRNFKLYEILQSCQLAMRRAVERQTPLACFCKEAMSLRSKATSWGTEATLIILESSRRKF